MRFPIKSLPEHSIGQLLTQLWAKLAPRRRWQFGLLLVLMVLTAFFEVLSIGAALPFLGALTNPERVLQFEGMKHFIQILGITEARQIILPMTILFGVAALISGAMRLLMLWASTRLAFAAGADVSIEIYQRTLYQPYQIHCGRNSSEVINGISSKSDRIIYSVILPILTLITSGIILFSVLAALVLVEPVVALGVFVGFGAIYACVISLTRKQLLIDSKRIARDSTLVIKSLQEGLGGIRDVLIDGSQSTYCKIYREADLPMRRAQGNIQFVGQSPRYALEALGMIVIAVLSYALSKRTDGIAQAIPILGAFALGAQRLLPAAQQAYSSWIGIRGSQQSLQDTLELLDQPLPDYVRKPVGEPIVFKKQIMLNNIHFRYSPDTPYVLNNLSLIIKKGGCIGFIGTTGCGKSTLLDLIMGLLMPTQGQLLVDNLPVTLLNNRSWQSHIAHVPQSIFLADCTIAENIAFGIPKDSIDYEKVKQAAQQAEIAQTIEHWEFGYATIVGERGIRLSGGQRQRIGIARALYKEADVIIFDEATSALDGETEQAVMHSIENLSKDLTILIVAHRLSTLKSCTQIVELDAGYIKRTGTYKEIAFQAT